MGWQVRFDGKLRDVTDEEREAELRDDPYSSRFEGGTVVDIDDFSPDELEKIAAEEGVSWYAVYSAPGFSSARLHRVIVACAKHAGIEVPDAPVTVREFKDRFDNWLEATAPADEKPMVDGFPPTPGIPEHGSSSGSPGDTDGHPTSSNGSRSEISTPSSTPIRT